MPHKQYTEREIVMAICIQIMRAWGMKGPRRREWMIWASKHQICPDCLSPAGRSCLNMADIRQKRPEPRDNRNPHDKRVDWDRMLNGFKERGYYKPALETTVRNWAEQGQEPAEDHMTPSTPMPDWAAGD